MKKSGIGLMLAAVIVMLVLSLLLANFLLYPAIHYEVKNPAFLLYLLSALFLLWFVYRLDYEARRLENGWFKGLFLIFLSGFVKVWSQLLKAVIFVFFLGLILFIIYLNNSLFTG